MKRSVGALLAVVAVLAMLAGVMAGPGVVLGASWSTMDSGTTEWLEAAWGSSPSDVFAIGGEYDDTAALRHYDGTTWSLLGTIPSALGQPMGKIWGASSSDLFVVGEMNQMRNSVFRYRDGSWKTYVLSQDDGGYHGIWGSSASDVWVVGALDDVGRIEHFDGSSWEGTFPIGPGLYGVWGTSASNAYAVGSSGTILHYSGGA